MVRHIIVIIWIYPCLDAEALLRSVLSGRFGVGGRTDDRERKVRDAEMRGRNARLRVKNWEMRTTGREVWAQASELLPYHDRHAPGRKLHACGDSMVERASGSGRAHIPKR
ncbi:hypothetical protein FRC12_014455 [Ceratobasidium sp. 428]|nr:hypothetical protein FRC12_014455 [Ceratobasidium sp. 428]